MIYWDHNATSPLAPQVSALLEQRAKEGVAANPSSVHQAGRVARQRLEDARRTIADSFGCASREVVFAASGTEANALCIKGAFSARKDKARKRVVTSQIEHPSVLGAVAQLEAAGADVVRLAVQADGRVSEAALAEALTDDVALCSLMWANNETGILQPVQEAARLCKARGIVFHSDAVQAVGKLPGRLFRGLFPETVTFRESERATQTSQLEQPPTATDQSAAHLRALDADLISFSAHKFGGPVGVAVCIVRRDVAIDALAPGHQEDGRRGGTPNVAYAEACALALDLAQSHAAESFASVSALRDRFERELMARLPGTKVNGSGPRVANTANLHFPGVDGEALLIALDLEGVCASLGAACASGSLSPSHVLLAMGRTPETARSSLRFSLGPKSEERDVDSVLQALTILVPRCR